MCVQIGWFIFATNAAYIVIFSFLNAKMKTIASYKNIQNKYPLKISKMNE